MCKIMFPHVENSTENRGWNDTWVRKKITGSKENVFSFKICRAKKYEAHESGKKTQKASDMERGRYQPLRGQIVVMDREAK